MSSEIAKRFEEHKWKVERAAQRVEQEKAELEAKYFKAMAYKRRVDAGLPLPDACPDCWVERGEIRKIEAATADDPAHYDRFRCRTCGYAYDVRIG